jgi:WD40 repeat protein
VTHVGVGHSGEITAVKISPDGKTIVSVSADGAILRWRFPTMEQELNMSSSGEQR